MCKCASARRGLRHACGGGMVDCGGRCAVHWNAEQQTGARVRMQHGPTLPMQAPGADCNQASEQPSSLLAPHLSPEPPSSQPLAPLQMVEIHIHS